MKQQRNQNQTRNALPSFTGYGPTGWTRGDEFIEDDICVRLFRDAMDASGIQVEVHQGNVTLSGYVPTQRNRQTASSIVMGVPGVKNLNNHLELGAAATPQTAGRPETATGAGRSRS